MSTTSSRSVGRPLIAQYLNASASALDADMNNRHGLKLRNRYRQMKDGCFVDEMVDGDRGNLNSSSNSSAIQVPLARPVVLVCSCL